MSGPGTTPKRRLSTAPAPGLSDSSHQPPSAWRAGRLTRSLSRPSGGPAGPADQQAVAGTQGGLHGPFGHLGPPDGPVHASLQVSAQAAGVVSGLQATRAEKGNR